MDSGRLLRRSSMRRSRWLLVVLFVVTSSVLVWACGGGGGQESKTPTAPAAATSPGETPQAQGDVGEFGDLAKKFAEATFRATYQVASTGGEQELSGTMTWYKKGEDVRVDLETEVQGETESASIIQRAGQSYFCAQIPELGGSGTCFQSLEESGDVTAGFISSLDELLTNPEAEIVSSESRDVAGQRVDCFVVRDPNLEADSEVCLTEDGVPLASKSTTSGEETTLEATDFSREVSDQDFELPYPVQEGLPGLPEQP
jgi:hypothetical protein